MISTSLDLVSLIEQRSGIRLARRATTGNGEYWGSCPFCKLGDNRFHVWPGSLRPHYWCRVCFAAGDAIQFLKDYNGLSYVEACEDLGIEPDHSEWSPAPQEQPQDVLPPRLWQEAAAVLIERAERYLWHPKSIEGQQALAYLRGRGFSDETIKKAHIGYVPLGKDGRWYAAEFESWGLDPATLTPEQLKKGKLRVPNGILIPWTEGSTIWKLAVKRPGEKMDYGQVMGSAEGLYNVSSIEYGKPCMIVEGEFDCLSVQQEAGDLVACVATGSTTRARQGRWLAELALASYVIQSYDDDQAGEDGAAYWLKSLSHCFRFQPLFEKDPNDILQKLGKEDLRNWVEWALYAWEDAQRPLSVPPPDPGPSTLAREREEEQVQPEKSIAYVDGMRILSGYSSEEYLQLLQKEAQDQYSLSNFWNRRSKH